METIVSSLIRELKLDDDRITNIYNYGSWVYGTNHQKSDRDFLIVMKSEGKKREKRLKFRKDFDYFHSFNLRRLKNTDVTIHSCENFELLLEKNYMLAVECVFYPNEFILRNNIDYKTIYLSKYFNLLRLKQVIFYENDNSREYIIENDPDDYESKLPVNSTINELLCDAVQTTTTDEDRILKYLFHGIRYLDIGEQLIRTKLTINDFKRASYILFQMRSIYLNNNKNIDFVVDYFQMKTEEYKTIINDLLPTNIIDGTFKFHISPENYNMEKFLNLCQINQFKSLFINLNNNSNTKQLMTSSNHFGTYPNIIEHIQTLSETQFKDFYIVRLKVKSLITNSGVPENDIDKLLFWDKKSNYFEFHYHILIKSIIELEKLKKLCIKHDLRVSHNVFKETSNNEIHYIVTMRLFYAGKTTALIENDSIVQYLMDHHFPPLKVESHFVVYDSNIHLDNFWSHVASSPPKTKSSVTTTRHRYAIGFHTRKVPPRSTN
jgi:predicted nucleotidyltransferase